MFVAAIRVQISSGCHGDNQRKQTRKHLHESVRISDKFLVVIAKHVITFGQSTKFLLQKVLSIVPSTYGIFTNLLILAHNLDPDVTLQSISSF